MKFIVHMLAFHDYTPDNEVLREVDVPDEEVAEANTFQQILELAFTYGQNDHQPVPERCSVSVGDVIEHCGNFFLICGVGFREITIRELTRLIRLPRTERTLTAVRQACTNWRGLSG